MLIIFLRYWAQRPPPPPLELRPSMFEVLILKPYSAGRSSSAWAYGVILFSGWPYFRGGFISGVVFGCYVPRYDCVYVIIIWRFAVLQDFVKLSEIEVQERYVMIEARKRRIWERKVKLERKKDRKRLAEETARRIAEARDQRRLEQQGRGTVNFSFSAWGSSANTRLGSDCNYNRWSPCSTRLPEAAPRWNMQALV